MLRRFLLRDGKMQEELMDGGEGREQANIQVEAIVQVRDLRDRLYKEVCSSVKHISRDDLSDRDFIFNLQEGDDGKLRAVQITKEEVMEMSANTVDLHAMTALLWCDPHSRIREITLGVSVYSDPLVAANNAIQYAYSGACSILDKIDPSFTAVKTDHVIFPIFAVNVKSATGLKQYRRQKDGSPGSFQSKTTVAVFQTIAAQLNQIIDKKLNGLLTRVGKEKEEELVVTIGHKSGSSKPRLRRYRCKVNGCPFTTPYSSNLKLHGNTHTNEVSFKCPGCPAQFTVKSNMVRHQPICPAKTGKAVGKVSFGSVKGRRNSSTKPMTLPNTSSYVSLPPKLPFANLTNSSLKRSKLLDVQGTIKFPPKKLALIPTPNIVEKPATTTIMTLQSENEELRREKHVATTTITTLQSEKENLRRENEELCREKENATTTITKLQSEKEDLIREKVQLKRDKALALRKANNSTNNVDYRR
ncbi:uncharacterized protein LOC110842572 isoform X2 [Folsomia candida]|uniref:uncharacterized protein LOC110842572 isoform X2 n=1 Tax=Folsomia candida TaxID=158441 RepID=UPI001604B865|nr:uncharacterized protein LOC110842572 isoform X2 [Folsomia candida]